MAKGTKTGALLRRLKAKPRSQRRWWDFVEAQRPPLYYSVYRMCRGDRELAEDITQEAFARFVHYDAVSKVQTEEAAAAYLRMIARNRYFSHVKRTSRAQEVQLEALPELVATDDRERRDYLMDIKSLLGELDSDRRVLLEMALAGEPLSVIAEKLNVSYPTAATRLHRLKAELSNRLAEGENP